MQDAASSPRTLNIRLWDAPYNGGWIWFDRSQWRRIEWGRVSETSSRSTKGTIWWAIFGFCGSLLIQSWPFGIGRSK
jgi:hypothetical protein